ncbi:uncharacterized protein [Apostichopus japonicus]|uniref:uncharacterized protein n=1 Tax=Stichopus japonicus TaxID=307972 RepID=UPI003AB6F085
MENFFKVCLTVLTIWNSFGTEMIIVIAEVRSSGCSYFVFQQPAYPRDCREVSNACSSTHNTSGVYLIKPDSYPEPFEAYCDNDLDAGGWTVLQRRRLDSVNFNRSWKDFRNGFGFLGSEFWIGNEKIAYLTNQKRYQLRMDFENIDRETYFVTYDDFRISDAWGKYYISSLGTFVISDESKIEWCPASEIFSNETCERTCDDPDTCISATSRTETEQCVCVGDYLRQQEQCIPLNQCNCFVVEKESVLTEGKYYINSRCTRKSTCRNNQLIIDQSYQCSEHATCDERNGVRKCYCIDGYEGDGVTCTLIPKDCYELYVSGTLSDGVYTIYPNGWPHGIQVYCEMESNGGGWTVFQRRSSASVDFYRGWLDYKNGFGNKNQDHWLGNKYIHSLTNQKTYKLRIDLRDSASSSYYAVYSTFSINNEADKYRLSIGSHSRGNTGYDDLYYSNNKQFSTKDRDNDGWSKYDCAERHRGAWWFYYYYHCRGYYSASECRSYCQQSINCELFPDGRDNCAYCAYSHLNGDYDGSTQGTNIYWYTYSDSDTLDSYGCSLQYTDMKIRPV